MTSNDKHKKCQKDKIKLNNQEALMMRKRERVKRNIGETSEHIGHEKDDKLVAIEADEEPRRPRWRDEQEIHQHHGGQEKEVEPRGGQDVRSIDKTTGTWFDQQVCQATECTRERGEKRGDQKRRQSS